MNKNKWENRYIDDTYDNYEPVPYHDGVINGLRLTETTPTKTLQPSRYTFEIAAHSFRKCGLFPMIKKGLDKTKLGPSMLLSLTEEDQESTDSKATEQPTSTSVSCTSTTTITTSTDQSPAQVTITPPSGSTDMMTLTGIPAEAAPAPSLTSTSTMTGLTADQTSILSTVQVNQVSPTLPSTSAVPSDKVSATVLPDNNTTTDVPSNGESNIHPLTALLFPNIQMNELASRTKQNVSSAFHALTVPEIKRKKTNTSRPTIPKALSGTEALQILREKEQKKQMEKLAKEQRKENRQQKRMERLAMQQRRKEEKEKKRIEKEKQKETKSRTKSQGKTKRKRDSTSEEDEENVIPFMDDSDEDTAICPGCGLSGGDAKAWIGCDVCPRWWHIHCVSEMNGKEQDQVSNMVFECSLCV